MGSKKYPTVNDVRSHVVDPNDSTTPKGANSWAAPFDGFGQTNILRRFRGQAVGNHWHPAVEGKNPEEFYLIAGRAKFWFVDVYGKSREVVLDADTNGVSFVSIPSYILHGLIVLSDVVVFIEQQPDRGFDPSKSKSAEEFDALVRSLITKA